MARKQLYSLVRDIEVGTPFYANQECDTSERTLETVPAAFIVRWPNGVPCIFVEWFLSDLSQYVTVRRNDGGTLKVLISDLSHLIRFCWKHNLEFKDLNDLNFNDFITELLSSQDQNKFECGRRRRTIRRIIDNSVRFLQWLQENIFCDHKIIGAAHSGSQIKAKELPGGAVYVSTKLVHPLKPPNDAQDLKGPMPEKVKLKLWDAVSEMSHLDFYKPRYHARFSSRNELSQELEYLCARRELLLFLLEATGARPGELARLMLEKNQNCAVQSKISIPTLKRRTRNFIIREVPVDRGVAIKLEVFIKKFRAELLTRLAKKEVKAATAGYIFLCSRKGTPISEASLTREFQRIVETAKISQRTCMSMFRHAYITKMVAFYLREFIDKNSGKVRALFSESDYLAVLKKVSVLTGHGDEKSLLRYIDLAWDEIGIYDSVDANIRLEQNLQSTLLQLSSLARQLRSADNANILVTVEELAIELEGIRSRTLATRSKRSK